MTTPLMAYGKKLAPAAVLSLVVCYALNWIVPSSWQWWWSWAVVIFFAISGIIFYGALYRNRHGQAFVRTYMAATFIRLVVYMTGLVVAGLVFRQAARGFVLHFFISYLIFTAFETVALYSHFKKNGDV